MTPEALKLATMTTPAAAGRRAERPAPAAPAAAPQALAEPPQPTPAQRAAEVAAAAAANRELAKKGSELTIEFEDALNRMVFRLVDRQTREVVRQIPSEEVLAIARALAENDTSGVLVRADA
jgi:flagellar protein FlaG